MYALKPRFPRKRRMTGGGRIPVASGRQEGYNETKPTGGPLCADQVFEHSPRVGKIREIQFDLRRVLAAAEVLEQGKRIGLTLEIERAPAV